MRWSDTKRVDFRFICTFFLFIHALGRRFDERRFPSLSIHGETSKFRGGFNLFAPGIQIVWAKLNSPIDELTKASAVLYIFKVEERKVEPLKKALEGKWLSTDIDCTAAYSTAWTNS